MSYLEENRKESITLLRLIAILQGDQLNMDVIFWYLGKSYLLSAHMNSGVHWTSHFIEGTRKILPCLTGHPVG